MPRRRAFLASVSGAALAPALAPWMEYASAHESDPALAAARAMQAAEAALEAGDERARPAEYARLEAGYIAACRALPAAPARTIEGAAAKVEMLIAFNDWTETDDGFEPRLLHSLRADLALLAL